MLKLSSTKDDIVFFNYVPIVFYSNNNYNGTEKDVRPDFKINLSKDVQKEVLKIEGESRVGKFVAQVR